jgi:leucyl-tRNA synthetase
MYNFSEIENKYKYKWSEDKVYEAVDFSPKPKKYILSEFPYPSGAAFLPQVCLANATMHTPCLPHR